jgi:hypothetical protein
VRRITHGFRAMDAKMEGVAAGTSALEPRDSTSDKIVV